MLVGSGSFFGFLGVPRVLGVLGVVGVVRFGLLPSFLLLLVDGFDACGIVVVAKVCISWAGSAALNFLTVGDSLNLSRAAVVVLVEVRASGRI